MTYDNCTSLFFFDWAFLLCAFQRSNETRSKNKSTRERVKSKTSYERLKQRTNLGLTVQIPESKLT